MRSRIRHAVAGTSPGTFRRRVASRTPLARFAPALVVLAQVMPAGLLTACAATEAPRPPRMEAPAPRLPGARLLAAVRRAPGMRTLPPGLTPALDAAAHDVGFDSDRCEAAPAGARIDACVFGDPAASTRVVLLGDSHAGMWLPALSDIARRRHWQLRFFGKPGCPAPDITVWNRQTGRPNTACDRFRVFAEQSIRAERPGLVLVADQSYAQRTGADRPVTATRWQDGLGRTLAVLRRSGARVVVIGDTPVLDRSGPECLAAHPRDIAACVTTTAVATRRVWNRADEAAARATGSGYVPVLPWLCGETCTPVVGDVLVYRNRFQLTATYVRMMTGVLEAALVPEFPQRSGP